MSLFILLSACLGVFSLCLAVLYGLVPRGLQDWQRALARQRWLGLALGSICLIWAAHHACIMLEGELSSFHIFVVLAVPLAIVLCFFFLDFLFARALGGFFILCSNRLLYEAFVHNMSGRGFYSLICLAMGVIGLFWLGAPWYFRDSLELAARRPLWSRVFAGLFLLFALVLFAPALLLLAR
jgi:hypothetical protein